MTTRLFDFSGPVAIVDDHAAEAALLSPDEPSPLWDHIRRSASKREVGLIHLTQMDRAIVPELALRSSGARLDVAQECGESVLRPGLAFNDN